LIAGACLLGLAGLVLLERWVLARMLTVYFTQGIGSRLYALFITGRRFPPRFYTARSPLLIRVSKGLESSWLTMSTMTYIRTAHDELSTKVEAPSMGDRIARRVRTEIGPPIVAIVASVVIMAGLIAFRLYWLMPASFHFQN
jgi:hypothetical protein